MHEDFPPKLETTHIGGFDTTTADRAELADWMAARCLAAREAKVPPAVILSSNGQGIALAGKDPGYDEAMAHADVIHADGMPVVMASRLLSRKPIRGRSATTDLFHDVAQQALKHGLRFFILGATEEQNRRAVEAMVKLYPGLQIVGRHDGYFTDADDEKICQQIVDSQADVLWVALGKPKQEIWSYRNRDRLAGVGCIKTCGGLYAFLTGDVSRAPTWMQKLGLEWLYRLSGDPRRLMRRYVITNAQAFVRLALQTK